MSAFDWSGPSKIGKALGRVDITREKATKNVEDFRAKGVDLATISGLSRKSQILAKRHGGQFSRAIRSSIND